jgi:ribosomal protein L11 methyltransferase
VNRSEPPVLCVPVVNFTELKTYPAIDVQGDSPDLILASVDDLEPTAVEERGPLVRVFFATTRARDTACVVLSSRYDVTPIDVPDEDWARRSQENLTAITVGRITILPGPDYRPGPDVPDPPDSPDPPDLPITIVIQPSMGFGTGHHATTRLCLAALQTIDLNGTFALDVGTGSGILAIAAARLGAAQVLGIDNDPDAIQAARESLLLNPAAPQTVFDLADLTAQALPAADVVTANLTGALLTRTAPALLAAVRPGAILIVSGLLASERDDVSRAFAPTTVIWEQEDDGWVGMAFRTR